MGHYIELVIEDGFPKMRFRCDYPEDAFCRRQPLNKDVEEWFEDEPLDAGGHQCSTEAWIEDLGIEEGLMGKDQVLASIPVRVGFDDGPVITRVFSLEAQHQATALEAAVEMARGQAEANRILAESLTEPLLRNAWIEAIKESGNAIVVPDGSTPFVQVPTPTE